MLRKKRRRIIQNQALIMALAIVIPFACTVITLYLFWIAFMLMPLIFMRLILVAWLCGCVAYTAWKVRVKKQNGGENYE